MVLRETESKKSVSQNEVVRVIIVDNNQKVRRELSRALSRTSEFQVVKDIAATRNAAEVVASMGPDVVLLEVKTGNFLGVEICEEISRLAPEIPVVVLTSYIDEEERKRVLLAGAQAYLIKSVPSSWLTYEIRRLVHKGVA